ncbi:hypothetical protein Tco_0587949 [Tanacetum coccineum]
MPLAMDTHADVIGTGQRTSVGHSELWQDLRNHAVYGEAHDVHPNRPVRGRMRVALRQQLRSCVVKEDGVSSLSVTCGSGVPVADDNIDPRRVPVAHEISTYNAVNQSQAPQSVLSEAVPLTNEIASSNDSNQKRVVQLVFEPPGVVRVTCEDSTIMPLNKVWHLKVCNLKECLEPMNLLLLMAVIKTRIPVCFRAVSQQLRPSAVLIFLLAVLTNSGSTKFVLAVTGHRTLIWATLISDVTIVVVYSSMVNGLKDNHMRGGQIIICTVEEIVECLIHILDEHHELVQLFQTARDKCRDDFVRDFKIWLYNIGGVHGYELLTSKGLGGIVFESGPRSHTDYDVIIEARGGPPQRINKLHQSYMSL